jgi:hypothetical protein
MSALPQNKMPAPDQRLHAGHHTRDGSRKTKGNFSRSKRINDRKINKDEQSPVADDAFPSR